ncbi:MAG TPA: hypothetical protein VGA78_14165, partial [Gemmatimonadales bacterium]
VSPPPPVVGRIELTRRNIFADSEATFFVPRLVNRFHVTTRPYVIERELLFERGQALRSDALEETARNLRRLGVFRQVVVDTVRRGATLVALVETQDGWSTKPELSFRSTGGQTAWRASLFEENLFGTASRLMMGYQKDPDRSAASFGFRQPRLFANSIGIGGLVEDRSDGTILNGFVLRPFLSFHDRYGWHAGFDVRDERVLRYFEGEPFPRDTLFRNYDAAGVSFGRAMKVEGRVYHRAAINGRVWRDDYTTPDSATTGPRVAQGSIEVGWEFRRSRYVVVRGFTASREEDVDLSTSVRASLGLTPKAFGHDQDGFLAGLGFRYAGVLQSERAFAYVDLIAGGRFTSVGLDSGSVNTGATVWFTPYDKASLVAHLGAGWLHNPRPGGEFDLGLGQGPRGYRLHAFSGDRAVNATLEYRYLAFRDLIKVIDLGLALFTDWGGAWYAGSRHRTGWDGGIGLRLGPSRSTDVLLSRIDLVYRGRTDRDAPGWLVVIGRGLTFSTASLLTN